MTSIPTVEGKAGQRILRNVGVLWVGQILQLICMTAWFAIVARYTGPSRFGSYAYAQATVSILSVFVNLGIDSLLIRDLAQYSVLTRGYNVSALRIKLTLGIIVMGGFVLLTELQGAPAEFLAIAIIVAANSLISSLGTIYTSMIYAFEEMQYVVIAQTANAVLTFLTGAAGVWLGLPFALILFFSLCATGINLILAAWFARNLYIRSGQTGHLWATRWQDTLGLAWRSIPFGIMALLAAVGLNIGIMLLRFRGVADSEIGYFSAALRIYSIIIIVPSIVSAALFPSLSKAFTGPLDRFAAMFELAWRYLFAITIPMAIGLWLISRDVISLIYGSEFLRAAGLLQILSLLLLNGVTYLVGPAMGAMNRQSLLVVIWTVSTVAQAIISWFAIPFLGAESICWSLVGLNLVGFAIYCTLLFRWLRLRFPLVWCLKTILAVLLMAVVTQQALSMDIPLMIVLIVATAVYSLSHLALGTLGPRDWEQVAGLLPDGNIKKQILGYTNLDRVEVKPFTDMRYRRR